MTTFEPDADDIEGIVRHLAGITDQTAVYDNSQTPHIRARIRQVCDRHAVRYLSSGNNDGTAKALNSFLRLAVESDQEWILYLDQDSKTESDVTERLTSTLLALKARDKVALVGSGVDLEIGGSASAGSPSPLALHEARYLIASGTLMRVSALLEVDGFDEAFRLDVVDHEICLRLRLAGWTLLVDDARRIAHAIGVDSRLALPGPRFRVSRHPIWRRELMWRNTTVMARRYARSAPSEIARLVTGRCVDTLLSAVSYREVRHLSAAIRGLAAGSLRRVPREGYARAAAGSSE